MKKTNASNEAACGGPVMDGSQESLPSSGQKELLRKAETRLVRILVNCSNNGTIGRQGRLRELDRFCNGGGCLTVNQFEKIAALSYEVWPLGDGASAWEVRLADRIYGVWQDRYADWGNQFQIKTLLTVKKLGRTRM